MAWPPELIKSKDILKYPAMFQFDQPNIGPMLSRTACTDTAIQMIIQYYKDKTVSLAQIRSASGIGIDGQHGLTIDGSLKALNAFGVTWYRYAKEVTASEVLQYAYVGPVLVGVGYGKYPSRKGAACGQGNLAQTGGRTDCGFSGAHAILVLGNTPVIKGGDGHIDHYNVFTRDPDHHSNGPNFDTITGQQLTDAMRSLAEDTPWDHTFAIYPTKSK